METAEIALIVAIWYVQEEPVKGLILDWVPFHPAQASILSFFFSALCLHLKSDFEK